eukprot:5185026-Prymnesium_polylepis.3
MEVVYETLAEVKLNATHFLPGVGAANATLNVRGRAATVRFVYGRTAATESHVSALHLEVPGIFSGAIGHEALARNLGIEVAPMSSRHVGIDRVKAAALRAARGMG